jgi:spore coat polysaccharide biosynthesis protein SpsF
MKNVEVQVVIQARMGSSRLPGKILKPYVGGYAVLEWIIARARLSRCAERVVVATTTNPKDDATEDACRRAGCDFVRGDEDDVLARFADAIKAFPSDIILQVNADEPLVDIAEMDRLADILREEGLDYANNHPGGLPLGTGSEAYRSSAFARVVAEAKDSYEHEHVTPYFYRHPELFKQRIVAPSTIHPFAESARLTLDTAEDFEFQRHLTENMGFSEPLQQPSTNEILTFLQSHPDIVAINKNVIQKTFPKA